MFINIMFIKIVLINTNFMFIKSRILVQRLAVCGQLPRKFDPNGLLSLRAVSSQNARTDCNRSIAIVVVFA